MDVKSNDKDLNKEEENDLTQTSLEDDVPEICNENETPTLDVTAEDVPKLTKENNDNSKQEDAAAQPPTSDENNTQPDASDAGGTDLEEFVIYEVLKMLDKVAEDGTKLKSTAENIHNLFEADMKDFDSALQCFSEELNKVVNSAGTDSKQLLLIRDALQTIMDKHVRIVKLEATNVRDEFRAHIRRLEKFRNNDIPQFAKEFMEMINEFLNSISRMVARMHNLLTVEDLNICQRIAYIENLLQASREKDEEYFKFRAKSEAAILQHINTIKKLLSNRAGRNAWHIF